MKVVHLLALVAAMWFLIPNRIARLLLLCVLLIIAQ
jgi:hypothetical protein